MSVSKDITGQKFGRWLVLGKSTAIGRTKMICVCDCGTKREVDRSNLVGGLTKSCGCLHNELLVAISKTHGASSTAMYRLYRSMVSRCTNKNVQAYKRYGGRGIYVDPRWLGKNGFETFVKHMGDRPSPDMTLDRIDNDGPYSPENCRWATKVDQARNKSARSSSKTGVAGVTIDDGKFVVRIGVNGSSINVGTFCTLDEAVAARRKAELDMWNV